MQSLFDPVVSDITSLLSEQIEEAKTKKNATIDVMTRNSIKDLPLVDIELTQTAS
jgi:hypothetical protein